MLESTTVGSGDDHTPSCRSDDANEEVYTFTLTERRLVTVEANGFDTVLYLRTRCSGSDLLCDDDSGAGASARLRATLSAGTYYLFVDGNRGASGRYSLSVQMECPADMIPDPSGDGCLADPCLPNPCTGEQQNVCERDLPGYRCLCNAGPLPDPESAERCVLDPAFVGETCAYPLELPVGTGAVEGSTLGARNDGSGSCGGAGADHVYRIDVTERVRYELLMIGYDSVLHVRQSCSEYSTQLSCSDNGQGKFGMLTGVFEPGTYYLFADSFSTAGEYQLQYGFRPDPCAGSPCPAAQTCVADPDWSAYSCTCPEGQLVYGDECVPDPCEPNPCSTVPHLRRCFAELPGHRCDCDVGYLEDGSGGCALDPDANLWGFFVFLNADNNLESFGYEDVAEMGVAGSTPYLHIAALFDTYRRDEGSARLIYVTQNGFDVLENRGEVDMSDWRTLREFGVWAIGRYPARQYALVLWNHGAGWRALPGDQLVSGHSQVLKGFSNDDHGGYYGEISISNGDYARALEGISQAAGRKLDVVAFDACLMGMYEVAKASAPYADYLVASSETEPGAGWPYERFIPQLGADKTMTPRQLAMRIVEAYHEDSTMNSTMAATDLSRVLEVDAALTAFADELRANRELYPDFEKARRASQRFFIFDDDRDLTDFALKIEALPVAPSSLQQAARSLVDALSSAIIVSRAQASHPRSHGLSIYFPPRGSGAIEGAYTAQGATWSRDTTWDDFLQDFAQN